MKKTKLLSLFLAGSLLFHTAGIDALATEPLDTVPVSEDAESGAIDISEQSPGENGEDQKPREDESNPEQPAEEGDTDEKAPAKEEDDSEQPSEEAGSSKQPSGEDDAIEDPSEEVTEPEQPSGESGENGETEDPADEEEIPEQPAEENDPLKDPVEETGDSGQTPEEEPESKESADSSVSENTISENTISENTLPEEDADTSVFSIFPGLGDDYEFSSEELADKKLLASHVEDIVTVDSKEDATIEDYPDSSDEYELGEVVYLAETKTEAEQVAKAFGGTLNNYSYEVAVIGLPKKATVALAVAAAAEPDIKLPAVWPNYYSYLDSTTTDPLKPSDPAFDKQWQHDYIGTRYAWAAGFKGEDIKVAVIDTGLDTTHEDLKDNALPGRNFVTDEDDKLIGSEVQNDDNQTHGTHVAGIIAAQDNNSLGGAGIAPDATVRGYCVFPADDGAKSSDIMMAVNAAVADKNDIINMSLGSSQYSGSYETVIKKAYEAGVAVFASAGNDDTDGNNFPAAFSGSISVGAVDESSARASFSNYGKTVNLSFPGVGIYSTTNEGYYDPSTGKTYGKYDLMSGTSQASPAAAGTAAVILSANETIRNKTGKARVDALLAAMKSSTTKCADSGMGAGTTYLPGVLKLATDMTTPETPVINVVNESSYQRGANKKDYIAESIKVTLDTKTAVGVAIYYSTDGKTPAYKNGEIINAANTEPYVLGTEIELIGAKSKTIKAIAVNPVSGKASKAASRTFTLTPLPTGVTLTPANNVSRIAAGKSLKLTAAVSPSYAISKKVVWSVDDKAKAAGITVSNGTVKTKATKTSTTPPGEYTVTATAVGSDGKPLSAVKADYIFTVIQTADVKKVAFLDAATNKAPKPVKLNTKTDTTQNPDADTNYTFDLTPYLTVTKTDNSILTGQSAIDMVVWTSSKPQVAEVANGVITPVGPGKAVIKAVSNDGGNKSASYTVTVAQPVTKITISGSQKVAAGKSVTLTAKVEPANATNKKLAWTPGNDNVTVSASGKVTAKKGASGSCAVTATAKDGSNTSSTFTITVVLGAITKITLSSKKLTLFPPKTSAAEAATTAVLTPTVTGSDGADKTLIAWKSSAPSIASVDENGKITAKAPGKATITCAATDGSNKKASCTVNVAVPMSKLVIGPKDGNSGYIAVGKKVKMAAKYYSNYGDPANKKINWEVVGLKSVSKDEATINKNGIVSIKNGIAPGGSITVRAVAQDGSGVASNPYTLYIWPNYIAARLVPGGSKDDEGHINGYYFRLLATDKKTSSGKPDWDSAVYVPDYCTATLSGPKNIGLNKTRIYLNGNYYALYSPIPVKGTTKNLDNLYPDGNVRLYTNECDKMTLKVKLKDGSNLTAKLSMYAVYYTNTYGYDVVGYFY